MMTGSDAHEHYIASGEIPGVAGSGDDLAALTPPELRDAPLLHEEREHLMREIKRLRSEVDLAASGPRENRKVATCTMPAHYWKVDEIAQTPDDFARCLCGMKAWSNRTHLSATGYKTIYTLTAAASPLTPREDRGLLGATPDFLKQASLMSGCAWKCYSKYVEQGFKACCSSCQRICNALEAAYDNGRGLPDRRAVIAAPPPDLTALPKTQAEIIQRFEWAAARMSPEQIALIIGKRVGPDLTALRDEVNGYRAAWRGTVDRAERAEAEIAKFKAQVKVSDLEAALRADTEAK